MTPLLPQRNGHPSGEVLLSSRREDDRHTPGGQPSFPGRIGLAMGKDSSVLRTFMIYDL